MKKVSFVCTTYRRFTCVERIVAQYHAQTYDNKELIIFNTDVDFPYSLGFEDSSIIIVNNGTDYQTGNPYENRGQICRDAVTHATGDYFMLADDDDVYLPWHIQQAVDGILSNGKDAWKPASSFFAAPGRVEMCRNTLEASVIVKMERIREIGFRSDLTGYEGLSWYTKLRDEGNLDENNGDFVPSYCFNWSDLPDVAGHKQSGDINNPSNFENHKRASRDYAKRPLEQGLNIDAFYKPYYNYIRDNAQQFPLECIHKYASKYL
jgi:glycosyltransferase involved in cell wall biosynthesis